MSIRLSPRLQRIADFIPQNSRVVDVGTDHAYLPIWLLQNKICECAIATDINEGPLRNAAKDAAAAGVTDRLQLIFCSGLVLCQEDAVDTIVIAGMGGETIIDILTDSPWATDKRLILQPQSKILELRTFLSQIGCRVADAALVRDMGRIYRVWRVEKGESAMTGVLEEPLLAKHDPLLPEFCTEMISRLNKQLNGLAQAKNQDSHQREQWEYELNEYSKVLEESSQWQP